MSDIVIFAMVIEESSYEQITDTEPALCLLVLFHRISDVLSVYRSEQLRQYHISATEYIILDKIVKNNGYMRPKDISASVFRARHVVSAIVGKLESRDLVERKFDQESDDRRAIQVNITQNGKLLVSLIREKRLAFAQEIMACFSSDKINELHSDLEKLTLWMDSCKDGSSAEIAE